MNKKYILVIITLIVIVLVVYFVSSKKGDSTVPTVINQTTYNSGENPQPGSTVHDLPVEPAAALARKDLATKLSVDEKSIVIMQITETNWSDSCLGLGGPAESCLQTTVPGFKIEMVAKGKTYFYRTDKAGTTIREEVK